MDSTSLFRTDALAAGDTKDGDASTRDPDMRSIDGVVEPCTTAERQACHVCQGRQQGCLRNATVQTFQSADKKGDARRLFSQEITGDIARAGGGDGILAPRPSQRSEVHAPPASP